MNYKQEEHRIRLYPTHTNRDHFTGLWDTIARQQHFLKLSFSDTISPTREQIYEEIYRRSGNLSPYSSQLFDKYRILYQKKGTVLLTNQPTTSLGTFFAVEDTDCAHRYFIVFAFSVGAMTESLTGMIVYFNEKGFCSSDHTVICQRVLSTYDMRNGIIREDNAFLYHQSLLFTQFHRDTQKILLYLNHLPYHTEAIENHTSYYTSYTTAYCGQSPTLFKRYLHIPLIDTSIMFDLGSLAVVEDTSQECSQNQRYFTIQSYQVQKKDVLTFLDVASLFPEQVYSDGYPHYCEQCHEKTVAATYIYKSSLYSTIQSGMGSSYCPNCRIRYSNSKKAWVCAQIGVHGGICDGLLETDAHMAYHSSDQTVIMLYDAPMLKYPYREKVRVQWIPSDDALDSAKISRMTYLLETPPRVDTI